MKLKTLHLTLAKIAQLGRHATVNTMSERCGPMVAGSFPVRIFLMNLFCSNMSLAELPE